MKSIVTITALASGIGFSLAALAGADCTTEPKEKWMPRDEMQQMILDSGYTIDRFKVDGNCYEIYGRNSDNQKVEIYFNPVNGEVVKMEIED